MNIIGQMRKSNAAWAVFGGFVVTIFVVNAEVYKIAVACDCTARTIVCSDVNVVDAGLPTTRGTMFDWTPPFSA